MRASTFVMAVVMVCFGAASASGQILRGRWVDETEKQIDKHRKTEMHVLVMDHDGKPVPGAKVQIELLRHAFAFGFHLNADGFADDKSTPQLPLDDAVWRCFNSVAIDSATRWPSLQPARNAWDFRTVDRMLTWADSRGFRVRFGAVTSADSRAVPGWLLDLDDGRFRGMIESHIRRVMTDYGRRVEQFDLHAGIADHNLVETRLGFQMIRQMHELAHATAPKAELGARFTNSIAGNRIQPMTRAVGKLRQNFVPFDTIVFDERVTGTVIQAQLVRSMAWIDGLNMPAVIGRLDVGGATPMAAAVNLETMLRVLFAEPAIEGIWFAGVTEDESLAPHAAFINAEGELTPAGKTLDGLVRKHWWTDVQATTDELGNVRERVFAGTYRITATLPGGEIAQTEVFFPIVNNQRTIMLQPIAAQPQDAPGTDHLPEVVDVAGELDEVSVIDEQSVSSTDDETAEVDNRSDATDNSDAPVDNFSVETDTLAETAAAENQ